MQFTTNPVRTLLLATLTLCFLAGIATAQERKPIYFGDLHTHTNLSGDAVLQQVIQGVNRGPEAACTYARACAQVDFFGLSDHAEMLNASRWKQSMDAADACNAQFGQPTSSGADAEMVVLKGFEWTAGAVRKYWGHKNVFFKNDAIPDHPMAAYTINEMGIAGIKPIWTTMGLYQKFGVGVGAGARGAIEGAKVNAFGKCTDKHTDDCVFVGEEPKDLFAYLRTNQDKLAEKDYGAIVIPHGTAWGMAKVGTDWDIQINEKQHDPEYQRLIEVYSGHGNSEEYRDFENNEAGYESCRVRAGRLTWAQCKNSGGSKAECREKAHAAAKKGAVDFKTADTDWGYCGECPDCFLPSEKYQNKGSVQAAMAMTGFSATAPVNYTFGFIAATDDHTARPASVQESPQLADWPMAYLAQAAIQGGFAMPGRNAVEAERIGGYFSPGGLVAVHAESRSREAIFEALQRKEVYGTSGPRMQLWFDAKSGDESVPMGGTVNASVSPEFSIEAWGGPREMAGCSEETRERWGDEVIADHCLGICYNPGNERMGIDRLEIIKITPQIKPGEPLRQLIQDPWMVIPNQERDRTGRPSPILKAKFVDPAYGENGRDALYYVRAIQEPTPMVNATPLRDSDGKHKVCDPGLDSWDCKTMGQERAWSSPIFLRK